MTPGDDKEEAVPRPITITRIVVTRYQYPVLDRAMDPVKRLDMLYQPGGTVSSGGRLSPEGDGIRWIAPPEFPRETGAAGPADRLEGAVMATVSRDGSWTLASVRVDDADGVEGFEVMGNPLLSCLHTDAPVRVAPHAERTTRQRLYFLEGDLDALQRRLAADRAEGALATPPA
jgi:hypothetical protein